MSQREWVRLLRMPEAGFIVRRYPSPNLRTWEKSVGVAQAPPAFFTHIGRFVHQRAQAVVHSPSPPLLPFFHPFCTDRSRLCIATYLLRKALAGSTHSNHHSSLHIRTHLRQQEEDAAEEGGEAGEGAARQTGQ